jgi:hypothetical protein
MPNGGDFNSHYRPDPLHRVLCIEQEAPGVFQILCACGETSWTPWGADSAQEIASLHLWQVGSPAKVVMR